MILDRVEADRGDSLPDQITGKKILHHMSDPVIWVMALMFLSSTMPAYAIGFFVTIILRTMGYSTMMSLILTAPPYVFAVSPLALVSYYHMIKTPSSPSQPSFLRISQIRLANVHSGLPFRI